MSISLKAIAFFSREQDHPFDQFLKFTIFFDLSKINFQLSPSFSLLPFPLFSFLSVPPMTYFLISS